nr:integrase, catalytic region, zinc finger, CCHC-type, peptidase aspartic, catalytic [Tanacetum cinerariifolium]
MNARVLSASKSSEVKKIVTVEDHRRILLLSKNQKTMSSECNNIKLPIRNDKYEIVCGTNKKTVSKFNCVSWQVVQICLWCVDSGCSKHMTGNIKLLINFVWKFLGTVRFGNDHIAAILGYGDLNGEILQSPGFTSLKNDREDIGKLGAKGDIGFFIGYSANYVSYRVYNRRTKKIMETIDVTFDELSAMAFEQNN